MPSNISWIYKLLQCCNFKITNAATTISSFTFALMEFHIVTGKQSERPTASSLNTGLIWFAYDAWDIRWSNGNTWSKNYLDNIPSQQIAFDWVLPTPLDPITNVYEALVYILNNLGTTVVPDVYRFANLR